MLHIAICDDDPFDLMQTVELVKQYIKGREIRVTPYLRAVDVLRDVSDQSIDIALLDIEMETPNGYEIAKELIKNPKSPVIIFITKSSAYTLKGYGIALRYLQKPLTRLLLDEALDAAVNEALSHQLYFTCEDKTIVIPLRDIYFLEMFGHYVLIHTRSGQYRFRSTLKEVLTKLPSGYFVLSHKSIIVNLEHIRSASNSEITMVTGEKVPISRRRMQEFNEAFYKYLER